MHQYVRDEMAKRFVALGPIIEKGTAIKKHHVGGLRYVHDAFPVKTDALIKSHQVERAFDVQGMQNLLGGEILDANDNAATECTKFSGQSLPGRRGKLLQLGNARCAGVGPIVRRSHWLSLPWPGLPRWSS